MLLTKRYFVLLYYIIILKDTENYFYNIYI